MASAIAISSRGLGERGVPVDHSTIDRWVQRYAPEIEKRLRWQWRRPRSTSWRVDKTYVKVRGKWTYLYRALDKLGNTIDFYLSPTRNAKAARRFLGKALNGLKNWEKPAIINTDKAPTCGDLQPHAGQARRGAHWRTRFRPWCLCAGGGRRNDR
jgi:transposase-like protein